jgi:hypothetical protein
MWLLQVAGIHIICRENSSVDLKCSKMNRLSYVIMSCVFLYNNKGGSLNWIHEGRLRVKT